MRKTNIIALFLVACTSFAACGNIFNSSSHSSSSGDIQGDGSILAHWKLQNLEGCYVGDIDTDELKFIDLSGNGNDLISSSEGNGSQLDIFKWDTGDGWGSSSSLKFDNTLALAQSVDPYEATQTSYSGAYVSGKYLQTVENAPLNDFTGEGGWTIEIIFKVSEDWNNAYNRYVGIFSRQGVQEDKDEPPFAMMLSYATGEKAGALGINGTTGLQYVHIDGTEKMIKSEYCEGKITTQEWVHFMVANNGFRTFMYVNGESIDKFADTSTFSSSSLGGWEVGVGRKLGTGEATMNTIYPEGLIRRLFCGSISEIRFSKGLKTMQESLLESRNKA